MKAAVLHKISDLRYEEVPMPDVKDDEVLVKIKSCGACGSDIPRVFSKGTYHFPTVIGHEFSGIVVKDKRESLTGKRVAIFPLLPCFECESCESQNYATCNHYDYYGSRRDGGMAEYIAVKRWNLVLLPDNISYDEGAMCEPVAVARHAVMKLKVQKGENILISGAGPIGIIAGQWAKAEGAGDIYYFDINERKIEIAKTFGFKEYRNDVKIDSVIEGTGHSTAVEKCLEAVKPFGKVVLMGNPLGDVLFSQHTYWHILRKELILSGTWNSSYAEKNNDWKESIKALSEGLIDVKPLITHTYSLSECNRAFNLMKEGKGFYNKVMLTMDGDESWKE